MKNYKIAKLVILLCLSFSIVTGQVSKKSPNSPSKKVQESKSASSKTNVLTPELAYYYDATSGLWGFKNKNGKKYLPAIYKQANNFSGGLACVSLSDKYGYIDIFGKLVIPYIYEYGYSNVSDGLIAQQLNNKWGYIDKTGKTVIPFGYDDARTYSEGLAAVKQNGKWGFVDKTNNTVLPFQYDDAFSFHDGLCKISINNLSGFIDKTGKIIIPAKYQYTSEKIEFGTITLKLNNKFGLADKNGNITLPIIYDLISVHKDFIVVKLGSKYGFVDANGRQVTSLIYESAGLYPNDGLMLVQLNSLWGYIDATGKQVIPNIFDNASIFSSGYAVVKLNGKYSYIDKTGKMTQPLIYDMASDFNNGLAPVKLKQKWGYINTSGKLLAPFEYDDAGYFDGLEALVKKDGKSFYINPLKIPAFVVDPEVQKLMLTEIPTDLEKLSSKMSFKLATGQECNLFPLEGVILGKTTVADLAWLGKRTTLTDNNTNQPYQIYIVNGTEFWYDNNVADHMYLTKSDPMPKSWVDCGINWDLSYNELSTTLKDLGFELTIIKAPVSRTWKNRQALKAEVLATRKLNNELTVDFKFSFDYGFSDLLSAPSTLYSLSVRRH